MRPWFLLSFAIITLIASECAFGKEASSGEYYSFYGDVLAVDPHSITIKSGGKRLVFQINQETRISGRNRTVSLDQVKPGGSATVMMKLGQGNAGVAVRIRFDSEANVPKSLKLYAARTIAGEVISGIAISNFVSYQPPGDGWKGGPSLEGDYHEGVFVMDVQRDGNVSQVKMVKSLGDRKLDLRAIDWLKKWRFTPNSVSEVQIPVSYMRTRY
jgi:TonB family protein